jgi:hypothetical protein
MASKFKNQSTIKQGKGIGLQGLGVKTNKGYTIGESNSQVKKPKDLSGKKYKVK